MKALIIAAGRGKRLGSLSKNIPKPLIKIEGISLIERVILTLKKVGIKEFLIVIGYLGQKIKTKLKKGGKLGVEISYLRNPEWKKGNIFSVLRAKNFLKEDFFFLLMSDHLFQKEIIEEMMREKIKKENILLGVDFNLSSPLIDLEDVTKVRVEDNKILAIGKNIPHYNGFDTGIFLCSKIIFPALEKSIQKRNFSLSGGINILAKKRKVLAFDIKNRFWIDIDTKEFLKKASKIINRRSRI